MGMEVVDMGMEVVVDIFLLDMDMDQDMHLDMDQDMHLDIDQDLDIGLLCNHQNHDHRDHHVTDRNGYLAMHSNTVIL